MKEKKTKAEVIIELNTQEALSKLSDMRVDLELADKPNIRKAQYTKDNQQSRYANPSASSNSPVKRTQPEEIRSSKPARKASVKVNSVEAHITNQFS